MISPVAVEKLLLLKFAKIKSRQDAPQTTFWVFLDIFYPPNFRCFEENGVFQQPQAITLKCPAQGQMSVMAISQQLSGVEAERDMMLATDRKMQSERTTP